LLQLLRVEEPWTLELDDALANSFIAPATDRFEDDKQLTCLSLTPFSLSSFLEGY
jgi:zinc finger protein